MDREQYLKKLTDEYRNSFDLTMDYEIGGARSYAYGRFSTVSEKYVLSPKVNLWSIHGFEHILFMPRERVSALDIEDARALMSEHMAPELVCHGGRYPEKDHMYSYLTIAFISDTTPDEQCLRVIKRFRYEKNYLMTLRGHAEGHIILIDLSTGRAYANRPARHLVDYYEKIWKDPAINDRL